MASRLSAPITEIIARLTYQVVATRILDGFKLFTGPLADAEGFDDFPTVRLQDFAGDESARTRDQSWFDGRLTLLITVKKGAGLDGLLDAVAKVMDAIEVVTSGVTDLSLASTTQNGLTMAVAGTRVTVNSLTAAITVNFQTVPHARSGRRTA